MFYYHKGLTRAARRTVATAITIAGRQGCTAVDTGHLLLAMLQTGRGTAVEFLRRKQITVTALSACAITKQFGRLATRRRQKPTMFSVM